MAELINLSSAAWKRQPQGFVNVNPAFYGKDNILYLPRRVLNRGQTGIFESIVVNVSSIGLTANGMNASAAVYTRGCERLKKGRYVFIIGLMRTSNTVGKLAGFGHQSNPHLYVEGFDINYNYAGKFRVYLRNDTGGVMEVVPVNYVFQLGVPTVLVFSLTSDTTAEVLANGVPVDLSYLQNSFSSSYTGVINKEYAIHNFNYGPENTRSATYGVDGGIAEIFLLARLAIPVGYADELAKNPWQLFAPDHSRFYLIPGGGGATSQTVSFSIDALIQRAGLTQSTSLDALLQSAFSRSLSIDGLIAAVQTSTISMDALLQIVGTRTISIDALLQAVKNGSVSIDALVQMTLSQSLSLDALIVAASALSASTDLDAFIQALKTAGISLDALLSQSKTATAVIDALIQASKAGTVSLDAIIAGASSTTVFVGLDALIQAIQSKTLSVDALLQKTYTNPLSLDAYVALTQIKTVSLDALLQNTKTCVISMDAILQMTKTAMVSFDALIQAAKTGVISLDAILVFATQASVLLDAYVQKTLSAGVGLDAIIGAIADMILPTGRVITVPASDRFVFVTHSDRVIQIQ